ncbi:MAG: hypothetical protein J0M00_01535 [Burkholderiales bacterium]|nr:hypothetical protein [Burkholderiales bacterium]
MHYGQSLIDAALTSMVASRYQLAQKLGEDESFIGKVYRGTKPLPPALAGRIAAVAGLNVQAAINAAVLSQEKDATKRETLARALGVDDPGNGLYIMLTKR